MSAPQDGTPGETQPASYELARFPETLAVVRLGPGSTIPAWAESSSVFQVTATATETTVLCAARNVPTKARSVRPFTAFQLGGERTVAESAALLPDVLAPLADEEIAAIPLTTYDALWVLVPGAEADAAEAAWRRRGHAVGAAVPAS
ncbi:hypothetical protein [Nocardioides zeae]|uniref:A9CJY8-like N-terminal domain-containing protein n=1 Tax=Nocardioides zeae TaxID=1457234 RepID=A0A6P0HKM9_9ACTN|nr:hypothetical protein [Nocardioides zeae]NEN79259.1 hypothetical protein [Nocardioides zeae]